MIKYSLICEREHVFEAWFSRGSDFDDQKKSGLLICPICADKTIDKAIMAPAISTARKQEAMMQSQKKAMSMMNAAADKIRKEIANKCENVGDKFAEEARAIHYGEKQERGIYGQASPDESSALKDEGIDVSPLPNIFVPDADKKLN
ncbi:DUF1178 family protein [Robiginitomaculum antarcticum]|uniref:DUF1178 family protein n=1 Tax=Robiginitomaculum antarcticum TaxID=437507 RepID=UPI0003825663|nr:DUF1178 family protein [Robiginitomaculum antarcticum]